MKNVCGLILSLLLITACDSGDIVENDVIDESDGRVLRVKVAFTNTAGWPDISSYRVCVCGYTETGLTPLTYKDISKPSEGATRTITLSHVASSVTRVTVSITSLSHKLIYNLYSNPVAEGKSGEFDAGSIRMASLADYVQTGVFDAQCIGCHGEGHRSAGLDLRRAYSHDMLVGQTAVTDNSRIRVVAGNASQSYLLNILEDETLPANAREGNINHPKVLSLSNDMPLLIREWINVGAESPEE